MKKTFKLLLAMIMMISIAGCTTSSNEETTVTKSMTAGTYTTTVNGMHAPIEVSMTVDEEKIISAEILQQYETPGMGDLAAEKIASDIVEYQSLDVDLVSGATITSAIVKSAFKTCLEDAGADIEALSATREKEDLISSEYTSDVVIVGGGGAGLSAAVAALESGATVTIIEKTQIFGGNSILTGGFMNAVVPELQDYNLDERSHAMESLITTAIEEEPVSDEHAALQGAVKADYDAYLASDKTMFDSENWFALQTWNGGDKLANIEAVKVVTALADDMQQYLIDNGLVFRDEIVMGGGAMYTRSRFPDPSLPNGIGYINTLEDRMYELGGDNLTVLFDMDATELVLDGDTVVGVVANDLAHDKEVTLHATNGVIMATGGFAGNVELRVEYGQGEKWPNLGESVPTSNTSSVTGDGIFIAKDAGANLVNMDQIQLLPYCDPESGMLNNSTSLSSLETYIYINQEGERFVREDGRRDDMSLAMMDQTGGYAYMFGVPTKPIEEMTTLAGIPVTYYLENNLDGYVYGETLEEVAEKMGVPVDTLRSTLETFNENATNDTVDAFGRASYTVPVNLDGPFLAWTRSPAVHHTMGGVEIDTNAHVLNENGNIINGLYAAGEITGVVHGSNRIGGNAISDYLVFGTIAGENAALSQ